MRKTGGLNTFENDDRIWSVSGYTPPIKIPSGYLDDIYLSLRPSAWGFGTWENRRNAVDWTNTGIEEVFHIIPVQKKKLCEAGEDILSTLVKHPGTYDIPIYYFMRKQNKYSVLPVASLLRNIGTDGSGVHFTSQQKKYDVALYNGKFTINPNVKLNAKILKATKKFYTKSWHRKCLIFIATKLGIYNFLFKHFAETNHGVPKGKFINLTNSCIRILNLPC